MFFFSMHPNTAEIGNHAMYSRGWVVKMYDSLSSLGEKCTEHLNSPISWFYGIRKEENFGFADFIAVDVDNASKMSLDAAMERYRGYIHFMGTTKSHNLAKGGIVSERYRVFVMADKRITSLNDYKALCLQETIICGGDWQACGGAMHFMPLKRIVSYSEVGRKLRCDTTSSSGEIVKRAAPQGLGLVYSGEKQIPQYIQSWLNGNVNHGQRNLTVFKTACGLKKRNFSEDEILAIILSSRIPLDDSEKVAKEVRATVKSAMKRGQNKTPGRS